MEPRLITPIIVKAVYEWIRPIFLEEIEKKRDEKSTITQIADILTGIGVSVAPIGFAALMYKSLTDNSTKSSADKKLMKKLSKLISEDEGFAEFIEDRIDDLYEEYKIKTKLSNLDNSDVEKSTQRNIEIIESLNI
ncbi:MAG: hypothetical protein H6557_08160 [Lewinellaceae bacterium]|nr:hypothetical protein [Bacteroidota bacterium]MCB9036576.1 hypothetical protein [Lewinellaceae bacterium]